MKLDLDTWYKMILRRDRRYDGRFFNGVKSTGIYCRPVCPARTPKISNCTLFLSAAAAEEAGFRPCLRCRPELAPGLAPMDATEQLAKRLALCLQTHEDATLPELASILGISDRHLRRVFAEKYGVNPKTYQQTSRLLLAKKLLTETNLNVTDVAFGAGFSSLRTFNRVFHEKYGLKPSEIRKKKNLETTKDFFQLKISFRSPFAWKEILNFLETRCLQGVEAVVDECYVRSLRIECNSESYIGWIKVSLDEAENHLFVQISASLKKVIPQVLQKVNQLFDLDCDPVVVNEALGELAKKCPGLRVPGSVCGFEMAVRAILGQLITVKAARTLTNRVVENFGESIQTPFPKISRVFPSPEKIIKTSNEELGILGITRARAQSIKLLAEAMYQKTIILDKTADAILMRRRLLAIKGIGPWTMEYISMRALGWADAFPTSDYGIKTALSSKDLKVIEKKAKRWKPWRAYAVMYLWKSLSESN